MIRIAAISALALALAGCNATVRPAVDIYVPQPRHHIDMYGAVPMPPPRPYYEPVPPRSVFVVPPRRPRCAIVWENHRGRYIERQVCGNHIP
jgi:hypothetical protein